MTREPGARSSSPQWRWEHPRVLIEHPDGDAGLELAGRLRLEGYSVAVCPGPDDSRGCPLSGAGECAVAHGADVVVSCLGDERPEARDVVRALHTRCPDVPLVVAAPSAPAAELVGAVREVLRV